MKEEYDYDLAVIGGGSAGTTAALTAARLNKKAVLIERDRLGGTCTNLGCIPTKSMLHGASLIRNIELAKDYGIEAGGKPDFDLILSHRNRLVEKVRKSGTRVMERAGVKVIKGEARLEDANHIAVDGGIVSAKNILIATGLHPQVPPIEGLSKTPYLTSESALEMTAPPRSVSIIGGAYIGLEYESLFRDLGVETAVFEAFERLAPAADPDISEILKESMVGQGVDVHTGVSVTSVFKENGDIVVKAERDGNAIEIRSESLMIATGRAADFSGLNLEAAGVEYDRKGIDVNQYLQTGAANVYAAGDVLRSLQLEHVAVYEGWLAATNMFSVAKKKADYRIIPWVMFSRPEIAGVGETEEQAARHADVVTEKFPYAALPMAQINEETEGMIKLTADARSGRLLGAHIIGREAGAMIHLAALAIKSDLTVSEIGSTIAAYPTLSQGFFFACDNLGEKTGERYLRQPYSSRL